MGLPLGATLVGDMTSRGRGCLAPTSGLPRRPRGPRLALRFLGLAVEVRLALLDEGAHRFLEMWPLHRFVELDDFPLHDRRQVGVEEVRPRLSLDRRERLGRVEGDLGGGLDSSIQELVLGQHLVDKADAARFRRVDDAAGEHEFHRLAEPDDVHEQPGAGELRQHPDTDEAHRQPGTLGGVPDVAGEGDREAGSDGDAVDRGDNRLRALDERDPVLAPVADAHCIAVLFGLLNAAVPALNVRTCAKALAGAGEDDGTDLRVLVVGLDRLPHLSVHGLAQGVQLVRVVQCDDADAASFFGEYLFVRHWGASFLAATIIAPGVGIKDQASKRDMRGTTCELRKQLTRGAGRTSAEAARYARAAAPAPRAQARPARSRSVAAGRWGTAKCPRAGASSVVRAGAWAGLLPAPHRSRATPRS